jgi:hypothetical protein
LATAKFVIDFVLVLFDDDVTKWIFDALFVFIRVLEDEFVDIVVAVLFALLLLLVVFVFEEAIFGTYICIKPLVDVFCSEFCGFSVLLGTNVLKLSNLTLILDGAEVNS